jgi:putative two-component system response regulator
MMARLRLSAFRSRVLPRTTKKPTALIVDDDSTLRYVMARIAAHAGYEIMEANDGGSAMEIVTSKNPNVVVADIRLPDFDGFELCRRIKADRNTKAIPVILVTSMYYEFSSDTRDMAEGKKRAKSLGARELFPRGEALAKLGPLLQKLAQKPRAKKAERKKPRVSVR